MQIPDPQLPKPARPLSPAESEDSIQKRQRPTEVNTVLALAGGDRRIEISTLMKDHKAPHTAKVNELCNMDNFGVVEVVDRPQSQKVLSTRWVSKQRLDGSYKVRLVARGLEQTVSSDTDFYAGTPKLTTLRALLTIAAIHGNPVAFGHSHSAFHQPPMPLESEPVYVEPALEAQLDFSKVWLCKKAFQGLEIISSSLGYSQHTENQRHELQPVDIRSFYVCEETCTTIRRFDSPASHGWRRALDRTNISWMIFEHTKTSLHLTDVVV